MSDPDRLATIQTRWFSEELHRAEWWADHASRDVPWLVGEVADLRAALQAATQAAAAEADLADERGREIARLRELLNRLEWAGTEVDWDEPDAWSVCPACHGPQSIGHAPGCELAAVLTGNANEPPPEGEGSQSAISHG